MLDLLIPTFFLISLISTQDLIPREVLFQDAKYSSISLSPDGQQVGFISPDNNKVKNVFVKCDSCTTHRQVTFETEPVIDFDWTGVPDIIIFAQDNDGDENTRYYKKNVSISANRNNRDVISDNPNVKAFVFSNTYLSDTIIFGLNNENPIYHNVYSFNCRTNQLTLVLRNTRFPEFVFDNDLNIRLAKEESQNGGSVYFKPTGQIRNGMSTSDVQWRQYLTISPEDKSVTNFLTFDKSNTIMYWRLGDNSDLGNIVSFPFTNPNQRTIVYIPRKAEPASVLIQPADRTLLAIAEIYHTTEAFVLNSTVTEDIQYIVNLKPKGALFTISMSLDMRYWLVTYSECGKPAEYYIYRRWLRQAEFLVNSRPELANYTMSRQIGFDFQARDNLTLQAYLSLPPQARLLNPSQVPAENQAFASLGMIPAVPQKMIALVHGGPNGRDFCWFDPMIPWLTNRGYAVLQVNFRASTGFGKFVTNAGNGEWGRKMNFDIIDGVDFMASKGIANRSEVAVMGLSYGGYETLAALTFTPDAFSCGVDIVGPTNLISLLETIPPYWFGIRKQFETMFGAGLETDASRAFLRSRSPLFSAKRVSKPLMVVQGANDPRVNQAESDQFVAALEENNIPVTYLLFPDEGHGIEKPNNSMEQNGYIETFLQQCLGGSAQPFQPGQYNSTVIVRNTTGSSATTPQG